MLTIKTFRDGDRLVVVFEGLKDIPSEEAMIQNYVNTIINTKPETVTEPEIEYVAEEPAEAVPIPTEDELPPEIKDEIFLTGPYEGRTPQELIDTLKGEEKRHAFSYMAKMAYLGEGDESLLQDIKNAIRKFLANFKGITDTRAYAEKLNDNQVDNFLCQFRYTASPEVEKKIEDEIGKNIDDIIVTGEKEERRSAVTIMADYFVSLPG